MKEAKQRDKYVDTAKDIVEQIIEPLLFPKNDVDGVEYEEDIINILMKRLK